MFSLLSGGRCQTMFCPMSGISFPWMMLLASDSIFASLFIVRIVPEIDVKWLI